MTAIDMIARRVRLAFLNVQAAQEALPDIVNIMAEELGWSEGWLNLITFFNVECGTKF